MLIVSKFHDYYDVGMKMGVDKTCVYQRETSVPKKGFLALYKYGSVDRWNGAVLAFCGKFYPFVYHETHGTIDRYVWTLEEALTIEFPKSRYRHGSWNEYELSSPQGMSKFFGQTYENLSSIFHEYRTPVFGFDPVLGRRYSWTKDEKYRALKINPRLEEIEFYKVKDPITAYQDIYMFMSGVIGAPPKPPEPVDDKIKAAAKGHDGPYSFKKPPGKRGKNKWR